MVILETGIEGCYLLKPNTFEDLRGTLTKIFHKPSFQEMGLSGEFVEEYFSVSSKGVVRGLHFQIPPADSAKSITCIHGSIFDVVVDLRKTSRTFGKNFTTTLCAAEPTLIYVPKGIAHGFMALEDNSIFLSKSTTIYSPSCDKGIKWDSCSIAWPDLKVQVSEKDQNMPALNDYNSPF